MIMPGRHTTSTDYRYAYNGMEQDNEVKGNGNSYTTEFRQYDPRLGRWLSLDPLMHIQPSLSPYSAFNNNPIRFIDPKGDIIIYGHPHGEETREGDVKFIKRQLFLKRMFGGKEVRKMIKFVTSSEIQLYIMVYSGEQFEIVIYERDENNNIVGDGYATGEYQFFGMNQVIKADYEISQRAANDCKREYLYDYGISYEECWEEVEAYRKQFLEGDNYKNGIGANAQIEFCWDDVYYENATLDYMKYEGSWSNNKRTLFWHEFYHAYRIMSGQVVDEKTEEINASNFANKVIKFDFNRKYYWDGDKILWNVKGGSDKEIHENVDIDFVPKDKFKSENEDGKE